MAFSVQLLCNILLCYVTAVPFFLQFHSADEEGSGDEGLALSRRENSWSQHCLEVTGQRHPFLAWASVQGKCHFGKNSWHVQELFGVVNEHHSRREYLALSAEESRRSTMGVR